ncbi:MAG: hypothetical protein J2P24_11270 [Streptosporangiales bacterium]|nr:hypothetical protein [Streptosporangiales bacterium]MBO0890795.1 hypothetical protein [Acidothermales bacterium]
MTDERADEALADRTLSLADRALELARVQVEVLTELCAADGRGDQETARRLTKTLDDVMADVLRVDRLRREGDPAEASDELACSVCGAATLPRYETPRLLGYSCTSCDWAGDDPVATATTKAAEARAEAAATVGPAAETIEEALDDLSRRGKAAHRQALDTLERTHETLVEAAKALRRAEKHLAEEQRGTS